MVDRDSRVWVTKDGRRIHLGEMGDTHLANTIAMVERKIGPVLLVYEMAACLGNQAPEAIDLDEGPNEDTSPLWRTLLWLRQERREREEVRAQIENIIRDWESK